MNGSEMDRRDFIKLSASGLGAALAGSLSGCSSVLKKPTSNPNVLFVFADQWRAQAAGYAGNPDVLTPNLDRFEKESVNFVHAISTCPVCGPYRASLMTGQYPLTHGMFLNDLRLNDNATSFADSYQTAGYQTAYIGKWHLDGGGRDAYIPPERRQGFEYWKVLECTHDYYHSEYYAGNSDQKRVWPGYDADAQTDDAVNYLNRRAGDGQPFALFLSWGGPHGPYRETPEGLLKEYDDKGVALRPNVPDEFSETARAALAGYYAHCTALDRCMGQLLDTLSLSGLAENTIVVFTSDHGDMLYTKGCQKKQQPYDESIRVPFLLRCPSSWNISSRRIQMPLGTPDIMPTLLSLSSVEIPPSVEGENLSGLILGTESDRDRAVLITCPAPFGQWKRRDGGREYRGVRTQRYTYVQALDGDWLLYDNQTDPYQMRNLIEDQKYTDIRRQLEAQLQALLGETGDDFIPGQDLVRRCEYRVDGDETIPYRDSAYFGQVSVPGAKVIVH
jgi:arylsulfatase A-like enzyme